MKIFLYVFVRPPYTWYYDLLSLVSLGVQMSMSIKLVSSAAEQRINDFLG